MEIKEVSIDLIKPYWKNPRSNEKTIKYLKESIKKYGFNVPLVLDKNYVIITGHARYKALRELGYSKVPVIISNLSENEAKEYRLADNKIQEYTTWDEDMLREELDLIGHEVIGFSNEQIKAITSREFSNEDIKKVEDKLSNKFEDIVKKSVETKISIICPYCGTEFEVDKKDI